MGNRPARTPRRGDERAARCGGWARTGRRDGPLGLRARGGRRQAAPAAGRGRQDAGLSPTRRTGAADRGRRPLEAHGPAPPGGRHPPPVGGAGPEPQSGGHHRHRRQHRLRQQGLQRSQRLRRTRGAGPQPARAAVGTDTPDHLCRYVDQAAARPALAGRTHQPPQERAGLYGKRLALPRSRRVRRSDALRRAHGGHHAAARGGGAHPRPLQLRHADRPAQQESLRRTVDASHRPRRRKPRTGVGAVVRPGQLQAGERNPGPRGR